MLYKLTYFAVFYEPVPSVLPNMFPFDYNKQTILVLQDTWKSSEANSPQRIIFIGRQMRNDVNYRVFVGGGDVKFSGGMCCSFPRDETFFK